MKLHDINVHHLNVKSTFLNDDLKEDIIYEGYIKLGDKLKKVY